MGIFPSSGVQGAPCATDFSMQPAKKFIPKTISSADTMDTPKDEKWL
jgi:hypothetical protein